MIPGLLHRLLPMLPTRRRRAWRYVSPRRRGVGLVVVALLLLVGYGYYHATHDAQVKRQVIAYLQRRTGGRVEVGRARFGLFDGVRIEGLRLFLPGDPSGPFIEAPTVTLMHRPSSLVLAGRLEPTQIVCVNPSVRVIEDVDTGQLNVAQLARQLIESFHGTPTDTAAIRVPVVRIRGMTLIRQDREAGQLITIRQRRNVDVALLPDDSGRKLEMKLEGPGGYRASGTMDLATGNVEWQGQMDLETLDETLPRKFRQWRQLYKVRGTIKSTGSASFADGPEASTQPERFVVNLEDVSMEMPAEQGGLRFEQVNGELAFDGEGVEIRRLTGHIAGAGAATFHLQGRYMGYDTTSGFRSDLRIDHLSLPLPDRLAGAWGDNYARINRKLGLSGEVSVTANVSRAAGGKLAVNGSADLKGVSAAPPELPAPLTGLTGRVTLHGESIEIAGVQGRCGQARVAVEGTLRDATAGGEYDVRIAARDLPFSKEVHDALPESYQRIWEELSPSGKGDLRVHLHRAAGADKGHSLLTFDLTGEASCVYKKFPYPVHHLAGEVVVDDGNVSIRSVTGSNGSMGCVVSGWVRKPKGALEAEIHLDVMGGVMDDRLLRALPPQVQPEYKACGLGGHANLTHAVFRYRQDTPLDFDIPVTVTDATLCHDEMPCRVDNAAGIVRITPDVLTIERLVGRRGQARVAVAGHIRFPQGSRSDLHVNATSLAMDPELRKALPELAQHWWDEFEPAGRADVSADLTRILRPLPAATAPATASAPAPDAGWDYRLRILPRDMRIRYSGFPYPLHEVNGRVEVDGQRMEIRNLTARAGKAPVLLSGVVTTDAGRARGDLAITAGPIPVDEQLLGAMGEEFVSVLRLKPGGTVSLALSGLKVGPGACPMPATATAPASAPAPALAWAWTGSIGFRDAVVQMGFGHKHLTGALSGSMSCPGRRRYLGADARIFLDSITMGGRKLTEVSGTVIKKPASAVLKVGDITSKVCGGRMAGFAEVSFAEPVKYGIDLSVENVDLPTFLGPDQPEGLKNLDVKGSLSGTLQMMAVEGRADSLRAKGRLQIVQGKLYKLPVLMGLLQLISLTLPSDAVFQDADVAYVIRGDEMVFQEISLRGSALSMVGAGTMDLKTHKLALTFVAGPPPKLPRIAGLSEVIEGLASALTTWRVTGTVSDPHIRQVPLQDLGATLRQLHEPGTRR